MVESRLNKQMTAALPSLREERVTAGSGSASGLAQARGGEWSVIYEEHFETVWRALRRFGVAESVLDDAAQEVFFIAFRRIAEFEGRSTLRTWLYGIALRVARRFHVARASAKDTDALSDELADALASGPQEAASHAEAVRTLYEILSQLDPEKRAVFVLSELEQMTAPEIAQATNTGLNTVYSRLRAARREFDAALSRFRAQDEWRVP